MLVLTRPFHSCNGVRVFEQSDPSDRFAYYDRNVDIVWMSVTASRDYFGDEQPWGLIYRDRTSESVAAIEIWSASKVLPVEILDALPAPRRPENSP
jgi:uncharacterized protein YuzE